MKHRVVIKVFARQKIAIARIDTNLLRVEDSKTLADCNLDILKARYPEYSFGVYAIITLTELGL